MKARIVILDYSFDWYLDQRYVHPKAAPGPLSREDVVEFCGMLVVGGIELLHGYWGDCSTIYLKQITSDAGLRIASYIFAADLAQPPADRRTAVDHVFRMLDRTVELGAPFAMLHPALSREGLPLEQPQAWLVEGLRDCAERAQSVGVLLVAENIDDPPIRVFMGRGTQCRDICAEVDSPAFRLIYDAGAALFVDEDPLETLKSPGRSRQGDSPGSLTGIHSGNIQINVSAEACSGREKPGQLEVKGEANNEVARTRYPIHELCGT